MGGRGWGGKGSSLTVEQLQSMGIGRGEGPGPTLAPPPLYPKLENPPLPLCMDASVDYMLILKKQFLDYLNDSPGFVKPEVIKSNVERYSDKYKVLSIDGKNGKSSYFKWNHMPRELRPTQEKRGNLTKGVKRKHSKQLDINLHFKKLEEIETNETNEDETENPDAVDKTSSDDEDKESDKEEAEDPDEEMDDGTDYVDNYFDNGEAFDDEDDNLDDGPVY